jgi:hypothetical protein
MIDWPIWNNYGIHCTTSTTTDITFVAINLPKKSTTATIIIFNKASIEEE